MLRWAFPRQMSEVEMHRRRDQDPSSAGFQETFFEDPRERFHRVLKIVPNAIVPGKDYLEG